MADQTRTGCALVTGASGGMGTAICRALIADGRRVILADREAEPVQALAAELGAAAHALVLDITDATAVAELPASVPEAFGPIDVLINNAGHDIGGRTRFDIERWRTGPASSKPTLSARYASPVAAIAVIRLRRSPWRALLTSS